MYFSVFEYRLAYEYNRNSLGAAVRYADILWCARQNSTPEEVEKVGAQFNICRRNWPTSSHVLHMVGKFYCSMVIDFTII